MKNDHSDSLLHEMQVRSTAAPWCLLLWTATHITHMQSIAGLLLDWSHAAMYAALSAALLVQVALTQRKGVEHAHLKCLLADPVAPCIHTSC
jgi:hypothetical protein